MSRERMTASRCIAMAVICAALTAPTIAEDQKEEKQAEAGDFPGDFDKALSLFHDGEGGQKGIGMSKLWPRVSVPALNEGQLRKLLVGNTFRTPDMVSKEGDSIAFYTAPGGSVEAWFTEWDEQKDPRSCPQKEIKGDDFIRKGSTCHKRRFVDVTGSWEIKNHRLCPTLTWQGGGTAQCWYFVMLLNRVALFDDAGEMLGDEKTVEKGKVLAKNRQ